MSGADFVEMRSLLLSFMPCNIFSHTLMQSFIIRLEKLFAQRDIFSSSFLFNFIHFCISLHLKSLKSLSVSDFSIFAIFKITFLVGSQTR